MPPRPREPDTVRLFVYGTLMSGEVSAALLTGRRDGFGARRLGPATTAEPFVLWRVGWYPAMTPPQPGAAGAAGCAVHGEVFEVERAVLPALDAYEDAPRLYQRRTITLQDGAPAEAYLWAQPVPTEWTPIDGGDWRAVADRYADLPDDPW